MSTMPWTGRLTFVFVIALSAVCYLPHAQATGLQTLTAPPMKPFTALDGGKALLPDVLVTAMTFRTDGTVYAGGRQVIAAPQQIPPVSPTGRGLWLVSHDHGAHWLQFSSWPADFSAQSIVVDPTNPRGIYVAGCIQGGPDCEGGTGQDMVLRSLDGGQTWQNVLYFSRPSGGMPTTQHVVTNIMKNKALLSYLRHYRWDPRVGYSLAFTPGPHPRLYACVAALGMLWSDDRGHTWTYVTQPVRPDTRCEILVDPAHPKTVYSFGGETLYRTTDGGNHWTVRSQIAGDSLSTVESALYVTNHAGLYRSIDGGAHWALILASPRTAGRNTLDASIRGANGWIAAVDAAPSQAGLYVARDGSDWYPAAFTEKRSTTYSSSLDFQAMFSKGAKRMWEDHVARVVFTAGELGGLFRWSSNL